MRAVIAIDSFKGSLSSVQAGAAVKAALATIPGAVCNVFSLADGGEGTVEALLAGMGGTKVCIPVVGPVGSTVTAVYGILPDGDTAIIEMASAAGLTLVPENLRDPMETTTFGVGQMICDAINRGCRRFIVGIGGSATNDGGTGMLKALGYRFLDANGASIPSGAKGLAQLCRIDCTGAIAELNACQFRVACDVDNPLFGTNGASFVYGPQKGASAADVARMDVWLQDYARLTKRAFPGADPDFTGAGAAGGLGFAFRSYLNARLESGIQIILDEIHIEDAIRRADIVITGEGRLDAQTVMGKAPIGVAKLAKKYHKPVIAFAGCITDETAVCNDFGIDAYFPILPGAMSLTEAMKPENAYTNLKNTAVQVLRLIDYYEKKV